MADFTALALKDIEATFGGGVRKVRAALGVRSMGIQVMEFPPNFDRYPEHDHNHDGQEEVYVTLRGSGTLDVEGEQTTLEPDTMVRVGNGAKRKVLSGPDGLRLMVLGGRPGEAYSAPEWSELGAPDPIASS
ncbi:MAG TPA: cupin domain-containing protein [Solirubrobacteraceae bacterium]|nr:cupin domain-containing protein [Solirubrobacteraceae bacterium]